MTDKVTTFLNTKEKYDFENFLEGKLKYKYEKHLVSIFIFLYNLQGQ